MSRMDGRLKEQPGATLRLAVQVAFELMIFFVPLFAAVAVLALLNVLYQDSIRQMGGSSRWLILLSILVPTLALSSYVCARLTRRFLPPVEYSLWTVALFSLLVFLIAFLQCTARGVLFLYSIGVSLLASAGVFLAIGLPLMAAKTGPGVDRGRRG